MSQDFHHRHQSSFFFPPSSDDGLVESQILRDKIRFQGFEPAAPGPGAAHVHHQLVGVGGHSTTEYETAGMLSEMFDFAGRTSVTVAAPSELVITGLVDQHSHQLTSINNSGDPAAAAMQLFLTNPQPRSPPQQHHQQFPGQGFHPPTISQPQYTWIPEGGGGGVVEGQGLSLSLASSLEAAGGTHHEMMFFNGHEGRVAATASSSNPLQQQQQQQLHFGFGTASSSVFSLAAVNVLRNSKYTRPAQEILEEFCSVGRGHLKKSSSAKLGGAANNSTASTSSSGGAAKDPLPLSPADRMEHQRRKVKLAAILDEVERRYSHYCEQMQMVVNSFDMVMGFGAAVPYTALAQKAMSRHFRCLKDAIQAQLKESCEMLGEKEAAGGTGITKGETPRLKVLEQSLRKQRAFHQMGMMEQEAWRPQRGLPERSVNVLRAWLFEHFLNPYPSDADKHLLARQTGLSRNQVANWFINARVRLWKPMIEEMYQQESKANELEEAGVQNDDVQETASDDHHHHHHHHHHQVPANRESESNTTAQNPTEPLPSDVVPITSQINALPETDPSPATYQTQQQHLAPPSVLGAASVGPTPNAQGFIPTASSYSHVIDACNNRFVGTSTATTTGGGGGHSGHHHHDNSDLDGPTMIRFGTTSATNAGDVSLTLGLRHGATPGNHPQEKGGFSFRDFGRAS